MLRWVILFLLIALFAGLLGFPGVAIISADIAKTIFIIFMVLFLIALAFLALGSSKSP
jgi:uncharacterized membrane protein YtjA (UPF0391 family)